MIHSLPKSLIDVATRILSGGNSFVDTSSGEIPRISKEVQSRFVLRESFSPYVMMCNHSSNRTNDIPDILKNYIDTYHTLKEQTSDNTSMYHWISQTEPEHFDRFHPLSFGYNYPPDNDRIRHRRDHLSAFDKELEQKHVLSLHSHEIKHVRDYSSIGLRSGLQSGSLLINNSLLNDRFRKNKTLMIQHPNGEHFDVSKFDSVLDRFQLHKNMDTYHGVSFDPEKHISSSGELHIPSYLSTSARRFSGVKYSVMHPQGVDNYHILQIHNKTGNHGLYLGNINGINNFSDDEYVLPRDSYLKVNNKKSYHENFRNSVHTLHVWDVERLSD
jgi:hypothetical protein